MEEHAQHVGSPDSITVRFGNYLGKRKAACDLQSAARPRSRNRHWSRQWAMPVLP